MTDAPVELILTGGPTPRQFTAAALDEAGQRVVEQFDWRADSTSLALDLGALAHAAVSGEPPD